MTTSTKGPQGAADPLNVNEMIGLSMIVATALQTGLLQRLFAGADTAEGHARALGLDPRATGLALDALVASGLAKEEAGKFGVDGAFADVIARGPGGPAMLFGLWQHAPAFVKTGEPITKMDRAPAEREQAYKGVVAGLGRMFEPVARSLAAEVVQRIGAGEKALRVLDVGCGSGVWSLAVAERVAGARVTGLDLPAVLAAFEERARSIGLGDRVATIPGDMNAAAIPEGAFDLAMIANVLRLEPAERAASLVRRLGAAVADGGALLVIDALASGSREKEMGRTVYAFHLAMRTEGGRVHPPDEVRGWLQNAGFSRIEAIDLEGPAGAGGHAALLARR
jgi:ubiquinone/menaquinone biosynthesis C-methylase UbiE